ncbi:MAG: PhoU domain-containing protein [Acidimicrobiales bacterium]
MTLLVGSAFDKAITVLATGDQAVAADLLASDDEIDAMHVSLTEQCYELLVRESPRATDLRLVVSVIRVLTALERIGDLCLRIAKTADDHSLLTAHPGVFAVLRELGRCVRERFGIVQEAWSANSIEPLARLETAEALEDFADPLMSRILELDGPDAARVAVSAFVVGRSLDRIGDHTQILSARLHYLITGDNVYLADEVI